MYPPFSSSLPLSYDSAPYTPSEILCPGSDDELSDGGRERKRRRVLRRGEEFLAGRGHFLLSAGLRGPFEGVGWANPWGNKQTAHAAEPMSAKKPRREDHIVEEAISRTSPFSRKEETGSGNGRRMFRPLTMEPMASPGPLRSRDYAGAEGATWLRKHPDPPAFLNVGRAQSPTPTPVPRPLESPITFQQIERGGVRVDSSFETACEVPQAAPTVERPQVDTRKIQEGSLKENGLHQPKRTRADSKKDHKKEAVGNAISSGHKALSLSQEKQQKEAQRAEWVKSRRNWRGKRKEASTAKDHIARKIAELTGETTSKKDGTITSAALRQDRRVQPQDAPKLASKVLSPQEVKLDQEYQVPTKGFSVDDPLTVSLDRPPEAIYISSRSETSEKDTTQGEEEEDYSPRRHTLHKGPAISKDKDKRVKVKKKSAARRLTFTPNGGPRLRSSLDSSKSRITISDDEPPPPPPPAASADERPQEETKAQELVKKDTRSTKTSVKTSRSSDKVLSNGVSKESTANLPEAQVQDPLPFRAPLVSTSTNLLETEKPPTFVESVEEDSYIDLATQAAVDKAMRRFNNIVADIDAVTPKKARSLPQNPDINQAAGKKFDKTPRAEPMSTQAMMDDLSPFAITTVKKRSPACRDHTIFQKSPSKDPAVVKAVDAASSEEDPTVLPTYSPSMSTSKSPRSPSFPLPSPSKSPPTFKGKQCADPPFSEAKPTKSEITPHPPPSLSRQRSSAQSHAHPEPTPNGTLSELTSFSVNPDGTLTESRYQLDGQYPDAQMPGPLQDTYGSLPSLDFTKPFGGLPMPKSSGESNPPPTNGMPTSTAEDPQTGSNKASTHIPTSSTENQLNGDDVFKTPSKPNRHLGPNEAGHGFQLQLTPEDMRKSARELELDAAVEEAGSFLADWNVEVDAKMGGKKSSQKSQKRKSILSGKRRSGRKSPRKSEV